MNNISLIKDCYGCTSCVDVCPMRCIILKQDKKGFLYPDIIVEKCINCGLCLKSCPRIVKSEIRQPISSFASISSNKQLIKCSTSGGAFAELAKLVLNNGGKVFGCSFENNVARHIFIESIDDLKKIQKSKYVQSNLSNSFIEVKKIFIE